jgi:DNA-binding transcriptional regulator/RsmH inhibitor MraZ
MFDSLPKFTGTHVQSRDDKGRVPFPAKLLAVLKDRQRIVLSELAPSQANSDAIDIVVSITLNGQIGVYTAIEYANLVDSIRDGKLNNNPRFAGIDPDGLIEDLEGAKEGQTLDNQNRFRIPAHLVDTLEFGKEVALVGRGDYVEIMPKEQCQSALTQRLQDLQRRRLALPSQGNEQGGGAKNTGG